MEAPALEALVHRCQQTLPEDTRAFERIVALYKDRVFVRAYGLPVNGLIIPLVGYLVARLGRIVQYLISIFVVVLALGQLGLDTAILVTVIVIVIAAFGLALGLGLGLGARSLSTMRLRVTMSLRDSRSVIQLS